MRQFLKTFIEAQKTIWLFLGDQKKKYIFYSILVFIIFFYELVPPLVFGKIIDFFTTYQKGQSLIPFYYLSIFLAVSSAIVALIRLTSKNKLNNISIISRANAKITLTNNLLNLSAEYHSTKDSGSSLQQIFTGSDAVKSIIRMLYQSILPLLSSFIGIIIIFTFLSPQFLIFMVLYMLIFFSIEFHFNKKIFILTNKENILLEKSSGSLIETTNNILAVKSLGFESEVHNHLKNKEEVLKTIQLKRANTNNLKWKFFQIVNGISVGLFLMLIGFNVINGIITVGSILVFYSYYIKLRESTQNTTEAMTDFIEHSSKLDRIKDIFESTKTTIRNGQDFPKNWDSINISNLEFNYPANDKGIYDLNLQIKNKEVLGIVGSTGSGKSTLSKLLIDLYQPNKGQIAIDKTPYNKISHDSILKSISVVPQEAELFNLSISENITIMREVDPDYLDKIIKITELNNVVDRLPNGLNTLIGEKGYSLSGGERQRMGIARALYKDADIIIFDEATSMLDGKTEKKIIKNVLQEFHGKKTFIFIAHRLAALDSVDRIIVFKDGYLVEQGPYDELKNKNGVFTELFESQIKNKEE